MSMEFCHAFSALIDHIFFFVSLLIWWIALIKKNILNKFCIPGINPTQYIINESLANVIKLGILKWNDCPGLIWQVHSNHRRT